jgi:hypothetical protein
MVRAMTTDPLRELLREARGELHAWHEHLARDGRFVIAQRTREKIERIDLALAQQPEPVARINLTMPNAIEWLKQPMSEKGPYLADWVPDGGLLYAAPPSAAALIADKRKAEELLCSCLDQVKEQAAEIERLKEEHTKTIAALREQYERAEAAERDSKWRGEKMDQYALELQAAGRALSELIAFYETTPEMNQHPIWKRARAALSSKALAENAGQIKAHLSDDQIIRLVAAGKAQALREAVKRFESEWVGPPPIRMDVAAWFERRASDHERGGE